MQFSGKFGVFTPPLEGSRPPLGKILDPPLERHTGNKWVNVRCEKVIDRLCTRVFLLACLYVTWQSRGLKARHVDWLNYILLSPSHTQHYSIPIREILLSKNTSEGGRHWKYFYFSPREDATKRTFFPSREGATRRTFISLPGRALLKVQLSVYWIFLFLTKI